MSCLVDATVARVWDAILIGLSTTACSGQRARSCGSLADVVAELFSTLLAASDTAVESYEASILLYSGTVTEMKGSDMRAKIGGDCKALLDAQVLFAAHAASAAAISKETPKRRTDPIKRFKVIQDRAKIDIGPKNTSATAAESRQPEPNKTLPSRATKPDQVTAKSSTAHAHKQRLADSLTVPSKNRNIPSSLRPASHNPSKGTASFKDSPAPKAKGSPPTVEAIMSSSTALSHPDRSCPDPKLYQTTQYTYNTATDPLHAQETIATPT